MSSDLDAILAQIRQRLIEQSAAPAQQTMEEIQVTGQRPQQQDPFQLIMNNQQPMPMMGGLTGMPTPGMGPASYNPLFKQGAGYGADDFAKTKDFLKEPSLGALMGK